MMVRCCRTRRTVKLFCRGVEKRPKVVFVVVAAVEIFSINPRRRQKNKNENGGHHRRHFPFSFFLFFFFGVLQSEPSVEKTRRPPLQTGRSGRANAVATGDVRQWWRARSSSSSSTWRWEGGGDIGGNQVEQWGIEICGNYFW